MHFQVKHYGGELFPVRSATEDEVAEMKAQPGAPHVMFACECDWPYYWTAKNLALFWDGEAGRYNGCRNIFPSGPECDCHASRLRMVVNE